jgi:hypothetical protein
MQGNESTGFEHSGTADETYREIDLIPSLLTNSLRVVLKTFGGDIHQITAHGSTATTNQTATEDLRDYGVSVERRNSHAVKINYERLTTRDGEVMNPLTEDVIHELFSELDLHLGHEDLPVAPDLAINSVTLRITDDRLAEVTPAQTAEFDLRFVADPAEEAFLERTERLNRDRGLYSELGFDRTNLNLHSVVETATKYNTQSDGRYFHWNGLEDLRPRAPELLTTRVNQHVLPDEYGTLKPYSVVDDRVLEIDEAHLEDELDATNEAEER